MAAASACSLGRRVAIGSGIELANSENFQKVIGNRGDPLAICERILQAEVSSYFCPEVIKGQFFWLLPLLECRRVPSSDAGVGYEIVEDRMRSVELSFSFCWM